LASDRGHRLYDGRDPIQHKKNQIQPRHFSRIRLGRQFQPLYIRVLLCFTQTMSKSTSSLYHDEFILVFRV